MSNKAMLLILVSSFSFMQMDCKDDPPIVPPIDPPYTQSIFLSVADSGLTEVYLTLSMTDTLPPRGFEIFRNNNKVLSGSLFGKETTLVDTTAILNTSYTYQAFRVDDVLRKDSSAVVATRTLDTTSHEFDWKVYTIGGASSSILYDALIENENSIWTVGQFFMRDSSNNIQTYNMAHWDGEIWHYKKIYVKTFENDTLLFTPIRSILSDQRGGFWLAGGSICRISKNDSVADLEFSRITLPSQLATIDKIYLSTAGNLYGVGNEGTIVMKNTFGWQTIPSGTTQPLTDIYGVRQIIATEDEIICIGSRRTQYNGKDLMRIKGTKVEPLTMEEVEGSMISVWLTSGQRYYIAGNGVYSKRSKSDIWQREESFPLYYNNIVRGSSINNIFVGSDFGLLSHFNGITWRHFVDFEKNATLRGLAVSGDVVVAVGALTSWEAVVIIGKANIN
jgi:hypothetical protein